MKRYTVNITLDVKARTEDEAKWKLGRLLPNLTYPTSFNFVGFPKWEK